MDMLTDSERSATSVSTCVSVSTSSHGPRRASPRTRLGALVGVSAPSGRDAGHGGTKRHVRDVRDVRDVRSDTITSLTSNDSSEASASASLGQAHEVALDDADMAQLATVTQGGLEQGSIADMTPAYLNSMMGSMDRLTASASDSESAAMRDPHFTVGSVGSMKATEVYVGGSGDSSGDTDVTLKRSKRRKPSAAVD